ncbi:hypothetical protein K474DRAFT_1657648 [Panus rudis PR-1116 ss-1]|nr:hypothetical protein K474DRAFT_1657648 [Panus rudis PR-1116 ss-1]
MAGAQAPWAVWTTDHTQFVYDLAYPNIPYTVTLHDVYHSLVCYRLSDARNKFASVALNVVERVLTQPEDSEHACEEESKDEKLQRIRECVAFLLGDGKKAVPFHWGNWGDGVKKTGTFQGSLILHTFANAHLCYSKALGPQDPFLKNHEDPPIGALILSIQAVERALSFFKTGEKKIPNASAGHFSVDNWGDHTVIVDGKPKKVKRATQYVKTLQGWKKEKWEEYKKAAGEHCEESHRKRAGVIVIDEDEDEVAEDSDDDFIVQSDTDEPEVA